jgi:hypothetical protein
MRRAALWLGEMLIRGGRGLVEWASRDARRKPT